jgi:rhodanese-related sulfurtransferase
METAVRTIERDELKNKIDAKEYFFLVETLAPQYYREGHLPGAVNLPPDKVRELALSVLPDKNAEIVVYCAKLT